MKKQELYNKEKYPWAVIIERPTDEVIDICMKGSEHCSNYYKNLDIPSLEKCEKLNKQDIIEEKFENPYIIQYITDETKKFLDLHYKYLRNSKKDYYCFKGNAVYRIVENK